MEVDMSSEAVTSRLRTMDELWLLSQKVMNAQCTPDSEYEPRNVRAKTIQKSIRQVLLRDWDPIGVSNDDERPDDEYDSYIESVYRILCGSRSEDDLVSYLHRTESKYIGIWREDKELLRPVARRLLELDVNLNRAE